MRFINDAVELVGCANVAVAEIELNDVSRQVIRPILSTGLTERVNRERGGEPQPGSLGMRLEIPSNVIDHVAISPRSSLLAVVAPPLKHSLISLLR